MFLKSRGVVVYGGGGGAMWWWVVFWRMEAAGGRRPAAGSFWLCHACRMRRGGIEEGVIGDVILHGGWSGLDLILHWPVIGG